MHCVCCNILLSESNISTNRDYCDVCQNFIREVFDKDMYELDSLEVAVVDEWLTEGY